MFELTAYDLRWLGRSFALQRRHRSRAAARLCHALAEALENGFFAEEQLEMFSR
jgi:hypothetical protein